jgi:GGDEF domain-containing protein
LQRKVTQDPATGLPNRSSFYEQLRVRVDDAIAHNGHVGVMVVRVRPQHRDVMVEISRRLARECREGDVLARLGVDEFGVILSVAARRSIVQSQVLRFKQAATASALLLPGGEKVELALRFGGALYPEDGRAISELLAVAREQD